MNLFKIILAYLAIVNLTALVLVGYDKTIAGGNSRRIAEKTFYGISLIGGSLGTLIGMNLFRHKTRKASFQLMLGLILILQGIILLAVFGSNP